MHQVCKRSYICHQEHHDAAECCKRNAVEEDVTQNVAFVAVPRVAVLATTMLWASIILPITPPVLLAAAISERAEARTVRR